MESIPNEMAISDARANLTDVVNAVHLQDRKVVLHRRGKPQAVLLPPDLDSLIDAAGGLNTARTSLRGADYHRAWTELADYLHAAEEAGQPVTAADLLDYMQGMRERHGLPPEHAPKRRGDSSNGTAT